MTEDAVRRVAGLGSACGCAWRRICGRRAMCTDRSGGSAKPSSSGHAHAWSCDCDFGFDFELPFEARRWHAASATQPFRKRETKGETAAQPTMLSSFRPCPARHIQWRRAVLAGNEHHVGRARKVTQPRSQGSVGWGNTQKRLRGQQPSGRPTATTSSRLRTADAGLV
jgi:hypothetical protein